VIFSLSTIAELSNTEGIFYVFYGKPAVAALGAVASLTKPINFDKLYAYLTEFAAIHDVLVIDDNPGVCQLVARRLGGSVGG
jgi:hypothetical protein